MLLTALHIIIIGNLLSRLITCRNIFFLDPAAEGSVESEADLSSSSPSSSPSSEEKSQAVSSTRSNKAEEVSFEITKKRKPNHIFKSGRKKESQAYNARGASELSSLRTFVILDVWIEAIDFVQRSQIERHKINCFLLIF